MSDYYAINDTMTQLNDNVSTDSNASESNPTLAHIACDFMWPFHNRSDITHCVLHQFPIFFRERLFIVARWDRE